MESVWAKNKATFTQSIQRPCIGYSALYGESGANEIVVSSFNFILQSKRDVFLSGNVFTEIKNCRFLAVQLFRSCVDWK